MDNDRFVPFARLLRAAAPAAASAAAAPAAAAEDGPAGPAAGSAPAVAIDGGLSGELSLLRAAALEAFERASARLLQGLAAEVLARELALAPHATGALVRRFVAELADFEPLALVLSPADAERVRASLPIRIDQELRPGDAIVEVRDGAFESHAAFRLESLIAAALGEAA